MKGEIQMSDGTQISGAGSKLNASSAGAAAAAGAQQEVQNKLSEQATLKMTMESKRHEMMQMLLQFLGK